MQHDSLAVAAGGIPVEFRNDLREPPPSPEGLMLESQGIRSAIIGRIGTGQDDIYHCGIYQETLSRRLAHHPGKCDFGQARLPWLVIAPADVTVDASEPNLLDGLGVCRGAC